jgi:nitrogen fixation protein NifM
MTLLAYYELKAAQALFARTLAALDEAERRRARAVAQRYADIEAAVLGSAEAAGVCLAPGAVEAALAEIRGRYPDDDAYRAELAAAGLAPAPLAAALRRELMVEAVLARVGAGAPAVGTVEAEIFYFSHLERFRVPETRRARHILVTINDALDGNRREQARARIDAIAARLAAKPERFAEQAIKHSECPTALNGGELGEVPRGRLYPELDAVLFGLAPGCTGAPVESPLGFHLLRCDAVHAAHTRPFGEVADALRERLGADRARQHSRRWLAALLARERIES